MKTLSDIAKFEILQNVLESKTFAKSPSSTNLLKFLVDATIAKKELKETTIGIEFLGKQFLDQSSSSTIRVNIYNLRKKLEKYYENEGKDANWKIVIDKGQYYTSFVRYNHLSHEERGIDKKKYTYVLGAFFLGCCALSVFFVFKFWSASPVPIWNSFFKSDKETILVIGDVFGFMATTKSGTMGWNRDYEINSLDDFYEEQKVKTELREHAFPASYTHLTRMGPIATRNLTKLFHNVQKDFSIRFSTNSNYDDIKERNSIYIGPIKNNNKFIDYFNERNPYFYMQNNELRYKNIEKRKDTVLKLNVTGEFSEYAIVSRLKGANGTQQFLFFSDHDIGVIGAVEFFCNPDNLKEFEEMYLDNTDTFTAVFVANGKERINLDLDLILIDKTE